MSVTEKFNKYAESYDQARAKLIPCYSDFYKTVTKIIPFTSSTPLSLADLGAGTGLLSEQIIKAYPQADMTLVDISEEMLNIAKKRLARYANVEYHLSDYSSSLPAGHFDLIVSSLSIHHLSDQSKKSLFGDIKKSLKANGIFINADQVLGENEDIERTYQAMWQTEIKEKGTTETELNEALDRMKEDKMATLANQMKWLEEANFSDVTCWYKNFRFAVYSATNK